VACLLGQLLPDPGRLHQTGLDFDARVGCAPQQSPFCITTGEPLALLRQSTDFSFKSQAQCPVSVARLEHARQTRIISKDFGAHMWAMRHPAAAMTKEEERELREQLARLQQEHRDLDAAISALQVAPGSDRIQVQRLKKRKLVLRDRISHIEDQLTPDIIA
jgi:hypothetical protein